MSTVILFIILHLGNVLLAATAIRDKGVFAFVPGDFIIGALFPLHHQPPTKRRSNAGLHITCGEIREYYGIQRVEVTFQTIDRINRDPAILPNITLGVEIRDECWYAPIALEQSIELIRDNIAPARTPQTCPNNNSNSNNTKETNGRGPLIGVIGPGASSVALQVQNLLQLFNVPQVGYSATSRDLSDKSRFNYFLRVVPSDYYQAQVILDIVRYFGWTYVSVVHTDENYGVSGSQAFRELADAANVCIAKEDSVLSNAADEVFDRIIVNLRQDLNARVVVCFCEGLTVRGLLRATNRLNVVNEFLFIGSDGWADRSDVTTDYEEEAWGGISIRIHSPYVQTFDKYYWSLKPNQNQRNPWFTEFWESRFQCSLEEPLRTCSGNETLSSKFRQDSKLSFVIRAIYSLAYALHNMQQDICGPGIGGICRNLIPFNGALFKSYLMNVSFEYDEDVIQFDENGDPPGRYDIMNYQKLEDGTFDYVQVGSWNNGSISWLSIEMLQFGLNQTIRKSVCSEECPLGHYKNVQQGGKDKRCCWVCLPCPSGEILNTTASYCIKCPLGFVPDKLRLSCLLLPIEYTQWLGIPALIAMSFAGIGFATAAFTLVIFIRHYETPVVKSSTRELCFLILIGMINAHGSIFPILAKPTGTACGLSRLLPGISFAMIYAALLTKTNRIARILAGSKKRFPTKKLKCMSSSAQLAITGALVATEVLIAFLILRYEPAKATNLYFLTKTILQCSASVVSVAGPLALDFLLILLCTLYAFKARNVPENFNEAKFIGFAMYTTCVIWIAFVPIYFGTDLKVITLALCVSLSALVIWLFIFVPKLYIILMQPEKNSRALFITCNEIRCHIGVVNKVGAAGGLNKTSESWREGSVGVQKEKNVVEPIKRSTGCQTTGDVVLNSRKLHKTLYSMPVRKTSNVVSIWEQDCCESEHCHIKNIIIKLPETTITPS